MPHYETPNYLNAVYLCCYFNIDDPETSKHMSDNFKQTFFRFPCSFEEAQHILANMPPEFREFFRKHKLLKKYL